MLLLCYYDNIIDVMISYFITDDNQAFRTCGLKQKTALAQSPVQMASW